MMREATLLLRENQPEPNHPRPSLSPP